jgi:hypothetical protein
MPKKMSVTIEAAARKRTGVVQEHAFKPGNPYRFRPGQSGNKAGRPKDPPVKFISKALHSQLGDAANAETCAALRVPEGSSFAICIAQSLIRAAVRGDIGAAKLIADSTEGTRSKLEFTDAEGDPLKLPTLEIYLVQPNREPALVQTLDASTLDAGAE